MKEIEEQNRDRVFARRLDWATGELFRGETPPDLVDAVMARRERGVAERRHQAGGRAPMAAALVLLGIGVVVWLALTRPEPLPDRGAAGPDTAGGELQEPLAEPVPVRSLAQIDALPPDARAVELVELDDRAFARLATRCPDLEVLAFRDCPALTAGVGEQVRLQLRAVRDARFVSCPQIDDTTVAQLVAMPFLRRLTLVGTDVGAPGLELLRAAQQLRRVDFGRAPWLTLDDVEKLLASGKRVTAANPDLDGFAEQLARLTVAHDDALDRPFYVTVKTPAEIAALPRWVTHVKAYELGEEAARRLARRSGLRGVHWLRDEGTVFTAEILRALGSIEGLEALRLQVLPTWDGTGLEHLAGLRSLRCLILSGTPVVDRGFEAVAALPALRQLWLDGCDRIGQGCLTALSGARQITELSLARCPQLGDRDLARLGSMAGLRRLDLAGTRASGFTVAALGGLVELEQLDLKGCAFADDAASALAGLTRLRRLELLGNDGLTDLMLLPVGLEELTLRRCNGLDGEAASLLRDRFPRLRSLVAASCSWIDDEALATILESPSLERLSIQSCGGLTAASFETLRDAKRLRFIAASGTACFTKELQFELGRQRPDLEIEYAVW